MSEKEKNHQTHRAAMEHVDLPQTVSDSVSFKPSQQIGTTEQARPRVSASHESVISVAPRSRTGESQPFTSSFPSSHHCSKAATVSSFNAPVSFVGKYTRLVIITTVLFLIATIIAILLISSTGRIVNFEIDNKILGYKRVYDESTKSFVFVTSLVDSTKHYLNSDDEGILDFVYRGGIIYGIADRDL
ncbi:hypothetical protein P9112_010851 [Eukaryota sp. TZLM1-RC]